MGGLAALSFTPWVGLAVATLLIVVVASYVKTVYAYPSGGGAYAVAKDQFGQGTALVAAAALVVDYILTVAVSVTAGVANLVSAFPGLDSWVLQLSLAAVVLLTLVNLRGVKESGISFALPTYAFIATVLIMLLMSVVRFATGNPVVAASSHYQVESAGLTGFLAVFLLLRAFASGCTALTGVEAISNGVPFFRRPKSKNAALTLVAMGVLAVVMFGGVTALAISSGVKVAEDPATLGLPENALQPTVIAQLGDAVFGGNSIGFYLLQLFTTAILILAANTAYNSFPIMASILGRDGYLPRQFGRRGDRLVYSNGVLILATASALLIIAFNASVTHLVQLYILGVFLSFSISQAGMVKRWTHELRTCDRSQRGQMQRSRALNALGAAVTSLVLVIVVLTKFTHGAWLVVVAIPIFVVVMIGIHRHYESAERRQQAPPGGFTLPKRVHAVVLISRLNAPALQALAYARASRPSTLVGLHVMTDRSDVETLQLEWDRRGVPVSLVILDSPYRDVTGPAVEYVRELHDKRPGDMIAVYVPEYVVSHWWEAILHNQSAIRLKTRLLFVPGVVTTSVPTLLSGVKEPKQPAAVFPLESMGDSVSD